LNPKEAIDMDVTRNTLQDLGDLEAPVLPLHPAFGGAKVGPAGALRVRTEIRAGTLAGRGNIVQAYPAPTSGH
jgi:hypothetical protein